MNYLNFKHINKKSTRYIIFALTIITFFYLKRKFKLYPDNNKDDVSKLEALNWKIEAKLRSLLENIEHRGHYLTANFDNQQQIASLIEKRTNRLVAKAELLLFGEFNASFRKRRLAAISNRYYAEFDRLQNKKCHLDAIVVCSLEQECGYACLLHQLVICSIISFYMKRTLIIARPPSTGMKLLNETFIPISNACRHLNFQDYAKIKRDAIRPLKLLHQQDNGADAFAGFVRDVRQLSRYHSEPIGYLVGLFISYALRFDAKSSLYQTILDSKRKLNINRPYVGVHIRLTDKHLESNFFRIEDYMRQVDNYYERYSIKYPKHELTNSTEKLLVYVACDEGWVYELLKTKYPNYQFVYNNTFTYMISNTNQRDTAIGFETIMFDVYHLANADHLICTFTSNICRLVYELSLAQKAINNERQGFSSLFYSLDTPYYLLSDAAFFKRAVDGCRGRLKRGQLLYRRVISGFDYDEYRLNGFYHGRTSFRQPASDYPSYCLRNHFL